jgi:[ribosomal protein S18]-alanine N-acetyltransferase
MHRLKKLSPQDHYIQKAITLLEGNGQDYPWSEEQIVSCTDQSYLWFGILEDELAGFCIFKNLVFDVELLNICIDKRYRNQGLGKKLLAFALLNLKSLDLEKCFLEVRKSNTAAIYLYKNLGFESISIRKNYYQTNTSTKEDAIIMAKLLQVNKS